VTIGSARAGAPEYQFADVVAVAMSPDRKIWVIDGDPGTVTGASRIRVFDSAGVFIRNIGRSGSGPGEYLAPSALAFLKDGRTVVRDFGKANAIIVFGAGGEGSSELDLRSAHHWTFGARYGVLADSEGVLWIPFRGRPGPQGSEGAFLRYELNSREMDTVAFPQLPEITRVELVITRPTPGGAGTRRYAAPYQPAAVWAWNPAGGYAVARTDRYHIDVFARSSSSAPSLSIQRVAAEVQLGESERRFERDRLAKSIADYDPTRVSDVPLVPAVKPPLTGLSYSDDGMLWVAVARPSRFQDGMWKSPVAFDVFDPKGTYMWTVEIGTALAVFGMNDRYVWGVVQDMSGVEEVRVYRIERPN
jgi:hypothetical protein